MTLSRLIFALADPSSLPAAGLIAVFRPRAGEDLGALPMARVEIIQGFRPDHDHFAAAGYRVRADAGSGYAAAVIFLPRAKAEARAIVCEAARLVAPGGPVWIDGQKTDGIDSLLREVRARVAVEGVTSKAHGKIFRFDAPGPSVFADWAAAPVHPAPGFMALPGVFSADGVDRGAELLAAALPPDLRGRVADLGAGWGWLAAEILRRPGVSELHLVEAEHLALECARRNISDPRAQFHWADATTFRAGIRLDAVVSNPPFHVSRIADPALGAAFIRAAATMLAPGGALWLVANRHLPYEAVMASLFKEVVEVGGDRGFKVLRAARPLGVPRPVPRAPASRAPRARRMR